jgi:hypothetical protein
VLVNIIAGVIILLIVGGACAYIYNFRKKGSVKCIGCPSAASCTSRGKCGAKKNETKTQSDTKLNNK